MPAAPVPDIPDLPAEVTGKLAGAALEAYKQRLSDHGVAYADTVTEFADTRSEARAEADDLRKQGIDQDAAEVTNRAALIAGIQAAYIEVAKGSLDRALQRGTFITTVAAAVATTYTALLGLIYGAADKSTPLPARGVIAFLFLGLSLVFSATYVAFLRAKTVQLKLLPPGTTVGTDEKRLRTFIAWTFEGVLQRAWALRLAVVSLGVALVMLPLPFVSVGNDAAVLFAGLGAGFIAVWALFEGANPAIALVNDAGVALPAAFALLEAPADDTAPAAAEDLDEA